MALADTAKLVASLELQDKFSATANKFDATVGGMERRVSGFGRLGGQVSAGLGAAATNLTRIGVVGIGLLGTQVAAGIQSLIRLEEVTAATNAVIDSTGGVAGISAAKVRELAEQYETLNATMDDKVIQSAENVLLTFTAIGEKAFPQALEAALNMNQALGGGEEGLQGTIIQVGKALQDPIRGLTALRRVGVNFTKAQEDQIKALVEANDLYGAQQLILQELGREFGGQFAAAGDTAAGRFAHFKDVIEDTQMTLATAFLPALEKVADKVSTLLADPATQAAIAELGTNLADAFDALVEVAGNLPWSAIGDAFRLMGTGSKALLDAFVGLPPWVQTAVLTGWGLNKLTGGALGSIVSTLASGLIKGVLGINAGVVNINAGTVVGGPGGKGPGIPPIVTSLGKLGTLALLTGAGLIGFLLGEGTSLTGGSPTQPNPEIQADITAGEVVRRLREGTPVSEAGGMTPAFSEGGAQPFAPSAEIAAAILRDSELRRGLTEQQITALNQIVGESKEFNQKLSGSRSQAFKDAGQTKQQLENLKGVADRQRIEQGAGFTSAAAATARAKEQAQTDAARTLQTQAQANMHLQQINAKDFAPKVNVSVSTAVSISDVQRVITSQQISVGRGPLEFE